MKLSLTCLEHRSSSHLVFCFHFHADFPFDDSDWIYELKMDGFRALAIIEHGRAQLLSRNGHPFASFSALAESISDSLSNVRAVIDGEICSLDRRGRPQVMERICERND